MLTASFFFFNDTATTEIYTLSLHDALPISHRGQRAAAHRDIPDAVHLQQLLRQYGGGRVVHLAAGEGFGGEPEDRSEEHTSELQSQSNLVCRLLLENKKHDLCSDPSFAAQL